MDGARAYFLQVINHFRKSGEQIFDAVSEANINVADYLEEVLDDPSARLPRLREVINTLKITKMLSHGQNAPIKDIAATSAEGLSSYYDSILDELEKHLYRSKDGFTYEANMKNIKLIVSKITDPEVKIII